MIIPSTLPLSSEHVTNNGIYLLENGEDALIYVGNSVDVEILQNVFGVSTVGAIPSQVCPDSLLTLLKVFFIVSERNLNRFIEGQRFHCF